MAHATANIAGRQREWAATGSDRRRDDACRERRGEPWRSPIPDGNPCNHLAATNHGVAGVRRRHRPRPAVWLSTFHESLGWTACQTEMHRMRVDFWRL